MSLYSHQRPVAGKAFVGRHLFMRSLQFGVRQGRSFLVYGGPKTGRTSVLEQTAELLRQRWRRDPKQVKQVPVYVDLGPVARERRAPARFAAELPRRLWDAISAAVLSADVFGEATPVRAPEPKLHATGEAWAELSAALDELWRRLQGHRGWCRYVLLVDHGDALLAAQAEAAVPPLMDLVSESAAFAPASTVIAGGRLFRERVRDDHLPLAVLRSLALGALKDDEAMALARRGFPDAHDEWLTALLHTTGKHPYLMQRFLAELEIRPDTSLDDVIAATREDCSALFAEIWDMFDLDRGVTYRGAYAAPEHALMQFLLDFGGEASLEVAERELGIRPLREYAEFLEYAGVVGRALRNDEPHYRASCDLWNIWYSERILR